MKRKTPDDYHALAAERDLIWLGPAVTSGKVKTQWKCLAEGHTFGRPYSEIKKGHGCSKCGKQQAIKARRKQPADYHAMAESYGWTWVGPEVSIASTTTNWECNNRHVVEASYATMKKGRKCGDCSPRRLSPDDYHSLAEQRGFKWLGPEVRKNSEKTMWLCAEKKHEFPSTYKQISRGRGCRECGIKRRAEKKRLRPADYVALANKKGWTWSGPEVSSVHEKTVWQCESKHDIKASHTEVRRGRKCGKCRRLAIAKDASIVPNEKYGPEKYHELAKSRGYRWVGKSVIDTLTLTQWRCPENHEFPMTYNAFRRGQGCRRCNTNAAGERRRYGPEKYRELAAERGIQWLGPTVENTGTKTQWLCKELHEFKMTYNSLQQGQGCDTCGGSAPKTPDDYVELARRNGIEWVGHHPANTEELTIWRCGRGHQDFDNSYEGVQSARGSGCQTCAQIARTESVRKTRKDYDQLAHSRGFIFFPPIPKTVMRNANWICDQGHPMTVPYNSIRSGSGCMECARKKSADRQRYSECHYRKLAGERGFVWQGPVVDNTWIKTNWTCEKDHTFEATYNFIQAGKGCGDCLDLVNGAKVSKIQRQLYENLGGELNRTEGRLNIDIALEIEDQKIAIEYDGWYWHGGHEDSDDSRDKRLIKKGWKILRIRSGGLLPTKTEIDNALSKLVNGGDREEIVLADWGKGATREESLLTHSAQNPIDKS